MFETHIYGYPIQSDLPLLETTHVMKPVRPGMPAIVLRRVKAGQALGEFKFDFKARSSHGRTIAIRSDRDTSQLFEGQAWCLKIGNLLSFYGRGGDHRIYYDGEQAAIEELLSFWFVHVVAPYALTVERGYCFLHAAAVSLEKEVIIFMADSLSGKSTLTEHFLSKGHTLVSDDKVAILKQDDKYLAVPSHPYFRPHRQHEDLGYHSDTFAVSSKPIREIYLLDRKNGAAIGFERVSGAEAMSNVITSCLSIFPVFWEDRLSLLGGIAQSVPMFRLIRPWGKQHFEDVYQAIRKNSRGVCLGTQ